MNSSPRLGALIIGDELLSGKRQDKHMPHLIGLLRARGLELAWVRMVGDDAELLTRNLRETLASDDIVFSFGGIGATPDDRTRHCAASAAGLPLAAHPQGLAELKLAFGDEVTPHRRRLVEFPQGSAIIPNPVNRVPGFSINDHHFVPGFPRMAWPMIEWVLDARYAQLQRAASVERAVTALNCRESQVIDLLEGLEQRFPRVRISCLPHAESGHFELELGVRGEPGEVAQAMAALQSDLAGLGIAWREVASRI